MIQKCTLNGFWADWTKDSWSIVLECPIMKQHQIFKISRSSIRVKALWFIINYQSIVIVAVNLSAAAQPVLVQVYNVSVVGFAPIVICPTV